MKRLILNLLIVLSIAALPMWSSAAVNFIEPETSTMIIDEGFHCPYLLEVSYQEGTLLTAAEMAAITKVEIYIGTESTDSDECAACFDYSTYAADARIVVDLASINWTDGSGTATMFLYSAGYTDGRRVGTFNYTVTSALSSASPVEVK